MFKKSILMFVIGVFVFAFLGCAKEESKEQTKVMEETAAEVVETANMPWNKVCPISGGVVDASVTTVSHDGKKWGFCCAGCDEKFAANPELLAANVSEDGTAFVGENKHEH